MRRQPIASMRNRRAQRSCEPQRPRLTFSNVRFSHSGPVLVTGTELRNSVDPGHRTGAAGFRAVAALGLAALMSAVPIEAQSVSTLVSNFNQSRDSDTFTAGVRAQSFKTGWNRHGFTLHSIDIRIERGETILGNAGSQFAMYICPTTAEGFPPVRPAEIPNHTACVGLTAPASFTVESESRPTTLTFTAPANTRLQRGTHYTVVNIGTVGTPLYDATLSPGEDRGSTTSWAIGNGYVWYNSHPRIRRYLHTGTRLQFGGHGFSRPDVVPVTGPNQTVRIQINGTAASSQVEAPSITGSPGLSDAGTDGAWGPGETAEVTLTFSEAVAVDTTGGTPSVGLSLGGTQARSATYLRGSGTTALVFAYMLTDADGSHTSLLVEADSLALNGGTIRSQSTSADAALEHNGVAKVGSPPKSERDAFSARFGALPQSHDGSSAFTFELHFSEAPERLSYKTVAKGLLDATGATVTKARRLTPGSNLAWEVTVTPSQSGDVAIRLPARACSETNAVCAGGRALAKAVSATVPGVPFTASFSGVPAEHDGATAFDMRFHLSEEPVASLSYRTVQNGLFDVTGGSIEKANRLEAGKNNGWNIRLSPSGLGDVTMRVKTTTACDTAPGVCTPDGRKLAGGLQAVIAGPAALSVADAEVEEASDATLDFIVTLSKPRYTATTVAYATSDGTATAGSDYTDTSGTLTFGPRETSKTVSVPVLNDAHDEGSETMTLTLSNPSGAKLGNSTATGTINNTDPMPKAWAVRFGRTIGSQVVDALTGRLASGGGSQVTVGGVSLTGGGMPEEDESGKGRKLGLPEWTSRKQLDARTQSMTMEELVRGSAFHLSTGERRGGAPSFTAWGHFSTGGFEAEEDDVTLDGNVTTGLLGADAEWDRLLAGIMVSQSTGDGSYRLDPELDDDQGTVESTMTGVYPYARLDLNERVSAWGLAGAGSGELTLHQEGGAVMETGLAMRMGALGVTGRVLDGSGPSGIGLNVRSDAMWVRTKTDRIQGMLGTEGDATRLRLILEADRQFEVGEGGTFTPTGEVGVRIDGGDAETGTGLELGAGMRYARGPVTIEGQVRALVAHEASGYEEWGASGAIRVTPSASGRGLTFSLAPVWGAAGSASERLWSARTPGELESGNEFEATGRIETEVGYGMSVPRTRGVVTPYTGLSLAQGASRKVRVGARWNLAPGAVLGLEGSQEEGVGGNAPTKSITFRTELRW